MRELNFQIKITYLNPTAYMDLAAAADFLYKLSQFDIHTARRRREMNLSASVNCRPYKPSLNPIKPACSRIPGSLLPALVKVLKGALFGAVGLYIKLRRTVTLGI